VKKYFIIILFSIALNFSFQPSATFVFEKHRIAFEISSNVDKATAEALEGIVRKRIESRTHLFLEIVIAENKFLQAIDSS